MHRTLIRREWLEVVRDGRARLLAGSILLLLAGALAAGAVGVRAQRAERAAAESLTRAHWLSQEAKNPHSAAHYGVYAFKPAPVLSLVDRGVDPYTGQLTWLEAHKQNEFKGRQAQDAVPLARLGALTASTVLQLLVPLLIIVVGFGAFAGEREQGTLRQLLALGVTPRTLTAGKALGLGSALAAVLLPATLLGVAAIGLVEGAGAVRADAGRLTTLGLVYLAYFALWMAITLGVSARLRTPRAALLTLLGAWMVTGLLAPPLAADVARRAVPVPTAYEFAARIAEDFAKGIDGHDPADARAKALERRVLAQYGVDSVSQLPVSFAGIALQAGEAYGDTVYDRRFGELWSAYERQEGVRTWVAVAAPVLAVRALSMGLAGTDVAQYRRFADAAERYRRRFVGEMNEDLTQHGVAAGFAYKADASLWARVPAFAYDAPSLAWVLDRQARPLVVLLAWVLVAGWWAARGARALTPD
jgi:ABC-2 type transport system permease protein